MKTYAPDRSKLTPPKAGGKRRKWKKLRAQAIQVVVHKGLKLCPESVGAWIDVLYGNERLARLIGGIIHDERKRASR